ncbi:hypothetical protein BVI1335_320131 [Burkholderia vietnamiensis]|nr:hypothetical protein BVI1335_320131 [Burkholderia vietnamiensis]
MGRAPFHEHVSDSHSVAYSYILAKPCVAWKNPRQKTRILLHKLNDTLLKHCINASYCCAMIEQSPG